MSQNKSNSEKIKILKNTVFVALAIIMVRLFFIQIIEHGAWVAKADEQHTLLETIMPKRGEIYMMDKGEPVAVALNQTTYQVVIDPAVTKKSVIEEVAQKYLKDYKPGNIDEMYATENLRYAIVAQNVPRQVAEEIAESGAEAVWLKKNNRRVYPEGDLASGLLGFVNDEGVGQYGAEGSFDQILAGEEGLIKTTADVNKVALSIGNDNVKIPAKNGKNVVLSVDRGLERGVEELAMKAVNETAATNASVLIMEPDTGKVVAMANLPNYDLNDYSNASDASAYVNYVTDVPYEPASVCKSFAFSAAINEGRMTADTTYYNQGYEIIDGWKIQNAEQRAFLNGSISMRTALYWSLNTGSIHALKLLGGDAANITQAGREKLYDYYYNKFRLGRVTGIELIEAEGMIPDPNEGLGRDSVYANMTFGQNLSITMVQTAAAFSAVVNGGYWRTPTIVEGELQDEEIVPWDDANKVEDKILSDETSSMMRDMLVYNRGYKVTGGIDRAGYSIGGKSGTAQVVKNGAYDDTMTETVGTYIGYVAPAGQMPEYVIMAKMWGDGAYLDGGIASNLFDTVSNYVIDYYKIKPGA